MRSLVRYVFLRLYGANLERSNRHRPDQALDDAVLQTNSVLVLVCIPVLALLLAIVSPDSLRPSSMDCAAVIVCAPLLFVVSRSLRKYAANTSLTELAQEFRSSRSCRITFVCFCFVPLLSIAVMTLVFKFVQP